MNADKIIGRVDVSMFGEKTGIADVNLLVDGQSIPVSRSVLSITSPVFRAMFQGDFKERVQGVIPLPGKNLDDVLTLLKCIYPDIMMTVTESVALAVLPLAEEYQMTLLKTKCEDTLLQSIGQKFDDQKVKGGDMQYCANVSDFLDLSNRLSLPRLKQCCISLAADFKHRERKRYMLSYQFSADIVKQIDELAISRLEIRYDDLSAISRFEVFDIRKLFNSSLYPKDIDTHMRGLRLAYSFALDDIKKLAVSTIRADKNSKNWSHDEMYNLLPENIKRDIEC
ncbi:uncharacterized protein LOC128245426 isoform X2 [Mya arenaria]|uniref:uncharacterized protein LOC128245426 isoform X2 n=1 Tax=Mya arenaria TaxID=6604 RepID=UPI0022E48AB8|nr:uncharacterized protein LOC128245426 isoform X2 [Mya arenaria]